MLKQTSAVINWKCPVKFFRRSFLLKRTKLNWKENGNPLFTLDHTDYSCSALFHNWKKCEKGSPYVEHLLIKS